MVVTPVKPSTTKISHAILIKLRGRLIIHNQLTTATIRELTTMLSSNDTEYSLIERFFINRFIFTKKRHGVSQQFLIN